jgi:hypothetical protein
MPGLAIARYSTQRIVLSRALLASMEEVKPASVRDDVARQLRAT